jgi:hypothetical protein
MRVVRIARTTTCKLHFGGKYCQWEFVTEIGGAYSSKGYVIWVCASVNGSIILKGIARFTHIGKQHRREDIYGRENFRNVSYHR